MTLFNYKGDLVRNGPPSPGDKYRGHPTPHKKGGGKKTFRENMFNINVSDWRIIPFIVRS